MPASPAKPGDLQWTLGIPPTPAVCEGRVELLMVLAGLLCSLSRFFDGSGDSGQETHEFINIGNVVSQILFGQQIRRI